MPRADAIPRKAIRCAIYCRKSTEEGLDQAFNSLDAQREACAAYILSHRHEGWVEAKGCYSDGGFSGGNLERPALRKLLADIEAGRIDLIIVYKIDRLTRSLADFAKIVEILDRRDASFVSVTQSFNTSTSMGRLTLNVLLSFAQFEREVTGERIRDKIAASKRKGMWMGGPVPLGYQVEDRKLVVVDEEAATVRHIFERYAVLGSGDALVEDLRLTGYRTKVRHLATRTVGGIPFGRGMLFHMLSNRIYRGEIVHRGEAHAGEHEAIIDEALWNTVHRRIADNRIERVVKTNTRSPSLLVGILYDGHRRRMVPSHTSKGGKRYRYYVTRSDELRAGEPPRWSVPAGELDKHVIQTVAAFVADRHRVEGIVSRHCGRVETLASAMGLLASLPEQLAQPRARAMLLNAILLRVQVEDKQLTITLDATALLNRLKVASVANPSPIELRAPVSRVRRGQTVRLVAAAPCTATEPDPEIVQLLRAARSAQMAFRADPQLTIAAHANATGQCRKRVTRLLRLSWLSPTVTAALLSGQHPARVRARTLLASDVPDCWSAQSEAFLQL